MDKGKVRARDKVKAKAKEKVRVKAKVKVRAKDKDRVKDKARGRVKAKAKVKDKDKARVKARARVKVRRCRARVRPVALPTLAEVPRGRAVAKMASRPKRPCNCVAIKREETASRATAARTLTPRPATTM